MIIDQSLALVPIQSPLSMVAGAGISIASNVLDLLGMGQGVAPASIIGTLSVFGGDFGIGMVRPVLDIATGVAFATATAATLNVALQMAADTGAAGGYLPGAWNTLIETGPITAANLTAQTTIFRAPFVPVFPLSLRPRYVRLLFQVPAATSFTAGTIAFALVVVGRDDLANKNMARNFTAP